MRLGQRAGDLRTIARRSFGSQRTLLELGGKRGTFDKLHHQVVRADVVQGANVRMVQSGDRSSFALETIAVALHCDLDGNYAPQPRIDSAIHQAHATGADRSLDFVRPELRSHGEQGLSGVIQKAHSRPIEHVPIGIQRKHSLHAVTHVGISAFEHRRAIRWAAIPCRVVKIFNLLPSLGSHYGLIRSSYSILFITVCMPDSSNADTTELLRAWADGDSEALRELTPRVYRELRRMAAHLLNNERPGYTLQSSDLVHEVYLRLVNAREVDWQHRAHFFAVSATLMRRILLDRARRRVAAKRGGKAQPLDLDGTIDVAQVQAREVVALDEALNTLAEVDPRKARIVELRFFGGLSVKETAEVVKVSSDTVMRDWKLARAWLLTELSQA
jgi:RNA polymerase sigma-70 factor (ECF subfamily)